MLGERVHQLAKGWRHFGTHIPKDILRGPSEIAVVETLGATPLSPRAHSLALSPLHAPLHLIRDDRCTVFTVKHHLTEGANHSSKETACPSDRVGNL